MRRRRWSPDDVFHFVFIAAMLLIVLGVLALEGYRALHCTVIGYGPPSYQLVGKMLIPVSNPIYDCSKVGR